MVIMKLISHARFNFNILLSLCVFVCVCVCVNVTQGTKATFSLS